MSFLERFIARSSVREARRKLSSEPTPEHYAELADELARGGDLAAAKRICAEGLGQFPGSRALQRLSTRSRQLELEDRLRELTRELRDSPRPALYREACELLLESGRYRRADEQAAAWYEHHPDPQALLVRARARAERFFADRGRDDGRQAWELLDRLEERLPGDEVALRVRLKLASCVGAWAQAAHCAHALLESHPGDPDLEERYRSLTARAEGAPSFEQGLREVEKTGLFADEGDSLGEEPPPSSTAIRPLLQGVGAQDAVEAVLFTRGSTALVQGLKGATAERTARALREVVHASRTTARRLGLGECQEIQLEGDFGTLLAVPGAHGAAGMWRRGPILETHQRALLALVSRSFAKQGDSSSEQAVVDDPHDGSAEA